MKPHEIQEKLGLTRIRDRNWYVQPACASTGDGLYEGLTWLTSNHKSWSMKRLFVTWSERKTWKKNFSRKKYIYYKLIFLSGEVFKIWKRKKTVCICRQITNECSWNLPVLHFAKIRMGKDRTRRWWWIIFCYLSSSQIISNLHIHRKCKHENKIWSCHFVAFLSSGAIIFLTFSFSESWFCYRL